MRPNNREDSAFGDKVCNAARDRHAIERAAEGYGLEIDATTLRHIEQLVRANKVGITLQTDRFIECEVMIGTVRCLVLYIKRAGRVVTFLPLHLGTPLEYKIPYKRRGKREHGQHRDGNIRRNRRNGQGKKST